MKTRTKAMLTLSLVYFIIMVVRMMEMHGMTVGGFMLLKS